MPAPHDPALNDAELATLRAWIKGGCLENTSSKAAAAKPKIALGAATVAPLGFVACSTPSGAIDGGDLLGVFSKDAGSADAGSAARFFYCAKASKSDRNEGLDDLPEQPSAASEFRPNHTEGAAAGEEVFLDASASTDPEAGALVFQ